MKTVISWLQNLRPLKVLTVFLAVSFLFLVQACNRPGIAAQSNQPPGQPPNAQRYDPAVDYPIPSYPVGTDKFSDIDPRAKRAEEEARYRAEDLINKAKRNVETKGIDSREQFVRNYQEGTPLDKRVKRLGEDIGNSAEELREGVTKGTQRGIENLQENVTNATKDLTKSMQRGAEDLGKNIQRTGEDTTDVFKRTMRNAD